MVWLQFLSTHSAVLSVPLDILMVIPLLVLLLGPLVLILISIPFFLRTLSDRNKLPLSVRSKPTVDSLRTALLQLPGPVEKHYTGSNGHTFIAGYSPKNRRTFVSHLSIRIKRTIFRKGREQMNRGLPTQIFGCHNPRHHVGPTHTILFVINLWQTVKSKCCRYSRANKLYSSMLLNGSTDVC